MEINDDTSQANLLPGARGDLSEVSIVSSGGDESEDEEIHLGTGPNEYEEIPHFGYLSESRCYKVMRELFLVSTNQRIHRAGFRSRYGIYQERSRQLASFPWMIHPFSLFRWVWDIVVSIALVVTLLRQPLVMAYLRGNISRIEHICGLFMGVLFIVDIILNFRTGIVSKHSDTIILDPRLVSWDYIISWFVIDLVSVIPYDTIFYFASDGKYYEKTDGSAYYIKYLKLLELLKIFRLSRVIRYVTRFQEAYIMNSMYIRVINLHITILLALHWLACVHYLVADMMNPPELQKKKPNSWVTRQELWNQTVSIKYINSVIRALSNMACLGYGLEVPIEPEDILCTIASIMIGATFFALFVGNLSSILINMDVAQKKYAEVLNQVMEYMRFKQIPKELQNRVVMYYEQRYRRNFFNENAILSNVSDVLRTELQVYNCRHLVNEVPLFQGLPQAIMQSIVARLKFEVYLPQDVIVNANTIGDAMFFIEHGAVSVLAPTGNVIAFLKDGDFFGEIALLTKQTRNASVVATSYCDTYRLNKADFDECVEGYPELYQHLMKITEAKAERLDAADMMLKRKPLSQRRRHKNKDIQE